MRPNATPSPAQIVSGLRTAFAETQSRLIFHEPDSAGWHEAWNALQASGEDFETFHAGECWQYMGTVIDGSRSRHEFRHRHHPKTQRREYRHFTATVRP